MQTFKHNIETGRCVFLELPNINNDIDALAIAANFLTDIYVSVVARIGVAKLNPKDKHYVKKIGREVAEQNANYCKLKVISIEKVGAFAKLLLKEENGFKYITIHVKRGSRVRVEI